MLRNVKMIHLSASCWTDCPIVVEIKRVECMPHWLGTALLQRLPLQGVGRPSSPIQGENQLRLYERWPTLIANELALLRDGSSAGKLILEVVGRCLQKHIETIQPYLIFKGKIEWISFLWRNNALSLSYEIACHVRYDYWPKSQFIAKTVIHREMERRKESSCRYHPLIEASGISSNSFLFKSF